MSPRVRAIRKLRIQLSPVLRHRIATHLDAVSIVDQAAENTVRQRDTQAACRVREQITLLSSPRMKSLLGDHPAAIFVQLYLSECLAVTDSPA